MASIIEFLEARITEDEAEARGLQQESDFGLEAFGNYMLAECAAKRAIIRQHEEWPVLVEREPSQLESVAGGLESITYRMTREIAWMTTREYVKRFGVQPPTAPMIRTLAAVYKDHRDYQKEWAADAPN